MKEEEIRPTDLLTENARLLDEDIARILQYKDEFVRVPCPACAESRCHILFDKGGFTFVECDICETVYTNPRPTLAHLISHYENSKCYDHYNNFLFPATEKVRREKIFVPRANKLIELCQKYNITCGTLIDVGAGFGTFCEEMNKRDIFKEVIAVEPSKTLAQSCRDRGITVIEKPVEDVELHDISVVTSFELVEHLYNPTEFIKACARVLSKNGFLYLTTPNIKGFDMLVMGKNNDNILAPNHINYFHPRSIARLLESCSFRVIEIATPGKLDADLVFKKFLSKELNLDQQAFLKEIFSSGRQELLDAFQAFLSANQLSSHMSVLAQKV